MANEFFTQCEWVKLSATKGFTQELQTNSKLFRPRPPIRDREALADFIDSQSAFIVQKGIYEYSRARAGHYAKVLFAEDHSTHLPRAPHRRL